jgi:hypothetical protein
MAAHKGPASSMPRCTRGGSSVAAISVYQSTIPESRLPEGSLECLATTPCNVSSNVSDDSAHYVFSKFNPEHGGNIQTSINKKTNKIYVGNIPSYVYYIDTNKCFGSKRTIFMDTRQLDREVYVTKYIKFIYANTT